MVLKPLLPQATLPPPQTCKSIKKARSEFEAVGTFLRTMRILHKDAIIDANCMEKCYAKSHQIYNHGGMALISPKYFKFAVTLTSACDHEISEHMICRRGTKSLLQGRKNILENLKLRQEFDKCHADISEGVKIHIEKIYKMLIEKTVHSRYGFESRKVSEKKFGHYARKSCTDAHRTDLKIQFANNKMKVDGAKATAEIIQQKLTKE